MSKSKQREKDLVDYLSEFIQNPQVAHFIYFLFILMTGYGVLRFLENRNFDFDQSLIYLGSWLVLIIMLDPPRGASYNSKPFETNEIIEQPAKEI